MERNQVRVISFHQAYLNKEKKPYEQCIGIQKENNNMEKALSGFVGELLQSKKDYKEHDLTIKEACEKWPDSLSRAFILGTSKGKVVTECPVYFLLDKPINSRTGDKSVPALKLLPGQAILVQTNVFIKPTTTVIPLTFEEFNARVLLGLQVLELIKESNPIKYNELKKGFETWGY